MKLVIDMNLSPEWVKVLESEGFATVHWSSIGSRNAKDTEIFDWARKHEHVVITLDVDFGTLLAISGASKPSVIQIRQEDVNPDSFRPVLLDVLRRFSRELERGALIVIDDTKLRIRMLPLR